MAAQGRRVESSTYYENTSTTTGVSNLRGLKSSSHRGAAFDEANWGNWTGFLLIWSQGNEAENLKTSYIIQASSTTQWFECNF